MYNVKFTCGSWACKSTLRLIVKFSDIFKQTNVENQGYYAFLVISYFDVRRTTWTTFYSAKMCTFLKLKEIGVNKPDIYRRFMELITISKQDDSVSYNPAFLVHPPAVFNLNVTTQLQAKDRCS